MQIPGSSKGHVTGYVRSPTYVTLNSNPVVNNIMSQGSTGTCLRIGKPTNQMRKVNQIKLVLPNVQYCQLVEKVPASTPSVQFQTSIQENAYSKRIKNPDDSIQVQTAIVHDTVQTRDNFEIDSYDISGSNSNVSTDYSDISVENDDASGRF